MAAGCEAAWGFFGGAFRVLAPDNLKAVVTDAGPVNPTLPAGWLDYAHHVGFGTDPARLRSPKDKPQVEQAVQYVGGNFWAGETFTNLAEAQARAVAWCAQRGGMRTRGTTAQRPAEHFAQTETGCLLPVPAAYDVPVFTRVKVHRDFHVEIAQALYSVSEHLIGQHLDARADAEPVKLSSGARLVKTHPHQPPGGRSIDRANLPEHKAGYAMRDLAPLIGVCAGQGQNFGIYAERLRDDPPPWTRMRAVYRLPGLVRRYGPEPVEAACSRSLDLEVVSVSQIAAMLAKATEGDQAVLLAAAGSPTGRCARAPHTPEETSAPPLTPKAMPATLTDTSRWSHARGNEVVPSRWQATCAPPRQPPG